MRPELVLSTEPACKQRLHEELYSQPGNNAPLGPKIDANSTIQSDIPFTTEGSMGITR